MIPKRSFGFRRKASRPVIFRSPKVPELKVPKLRAKKGASIRAQPELPFARKGEPDEGTLSHLHHCKMQFEKARAAKDYGEMHFWRNRFNTSITRFLADKPTGFGTAAFEAHCNSMALHDAMQSDIASSREWEELRQLSVEYRSGFLPAKKQVIKL